MPTPGRIAAVVAVAGGMAGLAALFSCDDLPITSVTFRVDDPWTFAQPAMPLLIEVRGSPGTANAEAAAEMVVSAMTRSDQLARQPAAHGRPGAWPATRRRGSS